MFREVSDARDSIRKLSGRALDSRNYDGYHFFIFSDDQKAVTKGKKKKKKKKKWKEKRKMDGLALNATSLDRLNGIRTN